MVAHFLRLKLTLLGNTLRRSVWQTVGLCFALLYALFVVGSLVIGAIVGGGMNPTVTGHVITLAGAVAVVCWWVVPVFVFGVDQTLDPQRFTTFAIPHRTLVAGLAVAGVVSVPGLATALAAGGSAFAWWREPWLVPVALLGAILGLASCVVGSRAVTTVLAPLLESRRYREVVAVVAIIPLVLIGPAIGWASEEIGAVSRETTDDGVTVSTDGSLLAAVVARFGELVAWTPFGAPWSLAAAVHDGAWGAAASRFAIAVGTIAVLWLIWSRSLAKALVTPPVGGGRGARSKGLGWFGRFPATPVGAVAARCTTYWIRDPRYAAGISIIFLMPVILWLPARSSGNLDVLLLAGPVVAWVLAFGVSNDVGYDYTAFALHVATGTSGRADRWGRALPVLVFGTAVVVLVAVLTLALSGRWDLAAPLLGICLGTLGLALGVSSVASAALVYPVPKPGESPLKSPQGAAMATMLAQTLAMLITVLLALPLVVLGIWAFASGSLLVGWVTLVVGLVEGALLLVLGIRMGARTFDRRAPELLQQVQSFP
ncbi:hypothetical protein [Myceligenerans pegani]|uniref:ABC-2 type transport system permease protein n=1 Tax=Myceligenerans pegani TaxID=2776917 RepID=A0ABR9MXK9_9MICO|nr:hypothetical protein [Myceligenerans sp. TRM 65318]MBE1876125.1 hypothetical protein [Myceligenerans sp. TRM 65318]MBE3018396.1 hypothetical protein [Myceligenerans sp. TRM 65318]